MHVFPNPVTYMTLKLVILIIFVIYRFASNKVTMRSLTNYLKCNATYKLIFRILQFVTQLKVTRHYLLGKIHKCPWHQATIKETCLVWCILHCQKLVWVLRFYSSSFARLLSAWTILAVTRIYTVLISYWVNCISLSQVPTLVLSPVCSPIHSPGSRFYTIPMVAFIPEHL